MLRKSIVTIVIIRHASYFLVLLAVEVFAVFAKFLKFMIKRFVPRSDICARYTRQYEHYCAAAGHKEIKKFNHFLIKEYNTGIFVIANSRFLL